MALPPYRAKQGSHFGIQTVQSSTPLILHQLIDCIATGRDPSVLELEGLAKRIWTEGATHRSAFSWDDLPPAILDSVVALRSALLALRGSNLR